MFVLDFYLLTTLVHYTVALVHYAVYTVWGKERLPYCIAARCYSQMQRDRENGMLYSSNLKLVAMKKCYMLNDPKTALEIVNADVSNGTVKSYLLPTMALDRVALGNRSVSNLHHHVKCPIIFQLIFLAQSC